MIAGLKPYPEMRDSGSPWLGQTPQHWPLQRLKTLVREISEKGFPDRPLLAATQSMGVVRKDRFPNRTVTAQADLALLKHVKVDDFVVSLRSFEGGIETAHDEGIISPAYTVLRATSAEHHGYVARLFKCEPFLGAIRLAVTGIREGQNVDYNRLRDEPVCVPPPEDRAAIVRFLDHADRRIRRSIAAKQKMIRLLEEQKAAIVHQAVTRGLDPDALLKPSGVDWIGDIPAHWDVVQARRLVKPGRRITYGIVQPGEPDPLGRFMVRGQDYSFGWGESDTLFRVSDAIEAPYQRSRLLAGDLVYTIVGAGVGNVAEVPAWLDGANITQTSARISVDPTKAEPSFVRYSLDSPIGRRAVDYYVKGAAQPGLNLEHLRVFPIPLPPLEEQCEILRYLETASTEVGPAIRAAKREIELLGEYRARLVADVVTGKVDVRLVSADLSNLEPETLEPIDQTALHEEPEADSIVEEEVA